MSWLSRFTRTEEPRASDPHENADEQAILDLLLPRAQARIDGQLHDSDALDAKALGVLGAAAAAFGLLVAVHESVNRFWWAPTAALGVAAVLLLSAVWPRTFDLGPDTRRFYEAMSDSTRLAASRQMLSELLLAVDRNDEHLPRKSLLFKVAFGVVLVALLASVPVALIRG
jgi:hypothetical protein